MRKIHIVQAWEGGGYEQPHLGEWESLKFFSERDAAELFAETYWIIYPDRDTRIVERDLLPVCPEVEVWYKAKATRYMSGQVHFTKAVTKHAFWEGEPGSPPDGPTCITNARDEALGWGRTPDEARKQVVTQVEKWNQELDEQLLTERKAALGNFLGLAGPMINEGL